MNDFWILEDRAPRRATMEEWLLWQRNYPDGRRIRINIEITPFQKRPHIDVTLFDSDGAEAAATSFIEPLTWKLEFTLHIRGRETVVGAYRLEARLYYPDGPAAEPVNYEFEITPEE